MELNDAKVIKGGIAYSTIYDFYKAFAQSYVIDYNEEEALRRLSFTEHFEEGQELLQNQIVKTFIAKVAASSVGDYESQRNKLFKELYSIATGSSMPKEKLKAIEILLRYLPTGKQQPLQNPENPEKSGDLLKDEKIKNELLRNPKFRELVESYQECLEAN